MGYYVDILFDDKKYVNFSSIISSIKREYPDCQLYEENDKNVLIAIDNLAGCMCIYKNRSDKNPGEWGYIRLSWACNIEENMEKLIEISEKIGCKIYDEPQNIFLDRTTMGEMKKDFKKGISFVSDFVGKDILRAMSCRKT
jgi:hypothetical protein